MSPFRRERPGGAQFDPLFGPCELDPLPGRDRLIISLGCHALRALAAPAHPIENVPDAAFRIAEPERIKDDLGNTVQRRVRTPKIRTHRLPCPRGAQVFGLLGGPSLAYDPWSAYTGATCPSAPASPTPTPSAGWHRRSLQPCFGSSPQRAASGAVARLRSSSAVDPLGRMTPLSATIDPVGLGFQSSIIGGWLHRYMKTQPACPS